jgi:hypothetical protein
VRTQLAAVLAGATLILSGCASDSAPTAATVATTTTSTVPTSTTEAERPEALSEDSRLSFAGIGPVRIGMTMEEVERAAGVPMRRTQLPACVALSPTGDPEGVELIFPGDGPLEFAFAREGSLIRTESGVALGDDEAAVLRAHPDAEVINPEVEVHRIVVRESDNGRRLLFEIERGTVSVMWSGPTGSERADEICT